MQLEEGLPDRVELVSVFRAHVALEESGLLVEQGSEYGIPRILLGLRISPFGIGIRPGTLPCCGCFLSSPWLVHSFLCSSCPFPRIGTVLLRGVLPQLLPILVPFPVGLRVVFGLLSAWPTVFLLVCHPSLSVFPLASFRLLDVVLLMSFPLLAVVLLLSFLLLFVACLFFLF